MIRAQTSPPYNSNSAPGYLAAVLHGAVQPMGDFSALDTNMVVMQILTAARESERTGRTIELQPLPQ